MASQTLIANRALTKLGAARIVSLADDNAQARAVASMWDAVRDAELRARLWKFALKRTYLAAAAQPPPFGYTASYPLPADCLRVVQVGEGDALDYRIEGRALLSDAPAPLALVYAARIEDTTEWDSAFAEAFACRLAADLAEALTQSAPKRELAWQEYKLAIAAAVRANAIEGPSRQPTLETWMTQRA